MVGFTDQVYTTSQWLQLVTITIKAGNSVLNRQVSESCDLVHSDHRPLLRRDALGGTRWETATLIKTYVFQTRFPFCHGAAPNHPVVMDDDDLAAKWGIIMNHPQMARRLSAIFSLMLVDS